MKRNRYLYRQLVTVTHKKCYKPLNRAILRVLLKNVTKIKKECTNDK